MNLCTHLHIPTSIRRHQRHAHPEQQLCFHNANIKTYRIPKMGRQYLIVDWLGSELQSKTAQTVCTHLHIPTPIRRHQRHTHPEQQLCFHNANIKTYQIPKNGPPIPNYGSARVKIAIKNCPNSVCTLTHTYTHTLTPKTHPPGTTVMFS